jgi:2-polyprenyl-3-methyl-5-hydroxy-6-metoxy-1,4-benzoquinol methylase
VGVNVSQVDIITEHRQTHGETVLGPMVAHAWHGDPKRFAFTAARYKFVAKMLDGRRSVLEVGCADAFFSRIVQQHVKELTAIDIDPYFIANARSRMHADWPAKYLVHDLLQGPVLDNFDAAYALDVLEHIAPAREAVFMQNLVDSLGPYGIAIIGMPSLESQVYASEISKAGHVNCKSGPDLKAFLHRWFRNVFLFSMNDEVVHTGYTPMAQYLLALCTDDI